MKLKLHIEFYVSREKKVDFFFKVRNKNPYLSVESSGRPLTDYYKVF